MDEIVVTPLGTVSPYPKDNKNCPGFLIEYNKYKNEVQLSFIFYKKMITGYKASPIDEGQAKFLQLFKERITL